MEIYINGIGNISIQDTLKKRSIAQPMSYSELYVRCIEPDYKQFFSSSQLRRMSVILKRAITTSLIALQESKIEIPDAIITGTGVGCMADTESFLLSMIENEEKFLQPTCFIHSTHNTISSQIAIHVQCQGYNNTFTHRGQSFEMALWDALLLFQNNIIDSALVGGHDEITPYYFQQLKKLDYWKEDIEDSLKIVEYGGQGSFSGEGSVVLVLSRNAENAYARFDDVELLYDPKSEEELLNFIQLFLKKNHLVTDDIDLFLMGKNGDKNDDAVYSYVAEQLFSTTQQAIYKHLCGEFFTASAFGLWNAASILKNNLIPEYQKVNYQNQNKVSKILIYNHFQNKYHSLILLSSCGY